LNGSVLPVEFVGNDHIVEFTLGEIDAGSKTILIDRSIDRGRRPLLRNIFHP